MISILRRLFIILFIGLVLPSHANQEVTSETLNKQEKTVLLVILARNKAHVLPKFLECIDNLDYNKNLISVYINTNNNQDNTLEILQNWVDKNSEKYRTVLFKGHHVENAPWTKPHDWSTERLHILKRIRQESLEKVKILNCDYYFVVDCDNFITPPTLMDLIGKDEEFIAPLLLAVPEKQDFYSNYFCDIDEKGYYKAHPEYNEILFRKKIGTFKVPVIHCTYLIKTPIIDKLTYVDGTDDYDFVILSRSARKNGVDQYICNEKNYGILLHFFDEPSLKEEADRVAKLPYLQVK